MKTASPGSTSMMVRLAKKILYPGEYVVNSVALNMAGFQIIRVLYEAFKEWLNGVFYSAPAQYKNEIEILQMDGMYVEENFFAPEIYSQLKKSFQNYKNSKNLKLTKNKDNTGVDWLAGPVLANDEYRADAEFILKHLANNTKIQKLAESIIKRRVELPVQLGFQIISLPENEKDNRDVESVLHADRHFSCAKAYFSFNENSKDNSAYVFCKRSHKMTVARLAHERRYSVAHAAMEKGKILDKLCTFERDRPRPNAHDTEKMGLVETHVTVPENSLVMSNNRGYHKRGMLKPGHQREQIRILFYDYQAPFFIKKIILMLKRKKSAHS